MNFRINLTQFYINFSRQEHEIDVLYVGRGPLYTIKIVCMLCFALFRNVSMLLL